MRRRLPALLLAILTSLVVAAPAQATGGFSLGVAAGEVTSTSAVLWTRAPRAGSVRLVVIDRNGTLATFGAAYRTVRAETANDRTVNVRVGRLRPWHSYTYIFVQGSTASRRGTFRTAPSATSTAAVRFAVSGDADAQPAVGSTRPFYNDLGVYRLMAREHNAFNINLGDTIYSDSEVPGRGTPALTVPQKWAKYRQNLAMPALQQLRSGAGLYSQWDDHEFINDFTVAENGSALYAAGKKAFLDYAPASWDPKVGTYRTFRWGRNLQLFILDLRSFRSAKASTDPACTNPTTKLPDLAPTVPALIRAGTGLPPLAAAVDPACVARINDPARTMLGAAQKTRFKRDVAASNARFKVVLTEDPIQQFYALPYDRWEGYAAERTELLTYLKGVERNLIFLATDTHGNFVNDARLETLEHLNQRVDSGFTEVVTGPAATMTFGKEIDAALGVNGAAVAIVEQLFRAPKIAGIIDGIAMQCAAVNSYAYAEVAVTSTRLTVHLRELTASGGVRAVRDEVTKKPCAAVQLTYDAQTPYGS
jgi:phosphodiesterase/alkaline phosphatase D-like protein